MVSTCSVMDVQFVRNTHYVFSVGKDCQIKYWDADKFELLLTLDGHHKEIWCMTISHRGDFIITGAHDRSIRRWDRTDEPFFIEVCFLFCDQIIVFHFCLIFMLLPINSLKCLNILIFFRKRRKKGLRRCLSQAGRT